MSNWMWLMCGMLAWQAIVLIVVLVTNEDGKAVVWSGVGLVGAIVAGVCSLIRKTIKWINSCRFVSLVTNINDGKLYYCPSWRDLVGKLMEYDCAYKWADEIQHKYKPSDGWRERDCCFGCINLRYTPIKIAKAEGAIPVDNTVLKAAKKAWDK